MRDTQVMLDSDLSILNGVETKALNQAVTRNPKRFPERFCFRLTIEETSDLRSQIAILHPELGKQNTWWRYMPRVFAEQGVSMLSTVLHSDTAIDVSVRIMDSFVEMRHFVADNAAMTGRMQQGPELHFDKWLFRRTAINETGSLDWKR